MYIFDDGVISYCEALKKGLSDMNDLLGKEKFEKCGHKGYRSCSQYKNPIMKKAVMEDITPSGTPIMIHAPSDEDKVEAAKLCEGCHSFRTS